MKRKDLIVKLEGTHHSECPGHLVYDGIVSKLIKGEFYTCDYCGNVFVRIPQLTMWQKLKGLFS